MDEYIKKSEAVDVIVKYPYDIAGKTATAIKMIEDLPSADVVPKSEVAKEFTCFVGDPHKVDHCPYLDEIEKAKSEVNLYRKQVDELEDELASTYDKFELSQHLLKEAWKRIEELDNLVQDGTRLGQENETLKDNNEHLAVMLEEARIELEAMRGAANSLKMHYEEVEAEIERLQAEKDALIKNYAECMKDYAREIFADVNMQIIPYSTDIYIKGEELIIIPKSDYNAILAEFKKKYTEGEPIPATEEKYFSPEDVRKMTNQEVREKYTAIRRSMEMW